MPQFIINQVYPDHFWTNSWLADMSPLNAFNTAFETRDGFAAYPVPPLLFYGISTLINVRFLTPVLIPLLVLGATALYRARTWQSAILLLSAWLGPVLLLSSLPYENERFSLILLPPLALIAGLGTATAINASRHIHHRGYALALAAAIMGMLGLAVLSQRHLDGFIAAKNANLAVVRAVAALIPAQSRIITFSISLTFDHYTNFAISDLWYLDPAQVTSLTHTPNVYLLADSQNITQQWTGTHVGDAYDAAHAAAHDPPLGQFGAYTLWRLSP